MDRLYDNLDEAKGAAERIGYPVVLRPAFTLGGTGGGFAYNEEELIEIGRNAFKLSPVHQVLIEKSVKGYKEIEFEVIRDASGITLRLSPLIFPEIQNMQKPFSAQIESAEYPQSL